MLPAVLAILVVVSAAAATAALRLQAGTTLAGSRGDLVALQGLADGVARATAFGLVMERIHRLPGLGFPEDGTALACALPGGRSVSIAVQDQGRLIDLNTTPRPELETAFRALGLDARDAQSLSAEIVDFRDPDDVPEPGGGAEAAQYRERGLAHAPRNGPFAQADEIAQMPTLRPALAARVQPALTVFNPGGRFDVRTFADKNFAGKDFADQNFATMALPGRAGSDGGAAPPAPSPRQYFRIAVTAGDANGTSAGRAAILSMGGAATGTGIIGWTRTGGAGARPTGSHPGCARLLAALLSE